MPLDAILEEKQPGLQLPPYTVATELLRDPILNALADNLQGIRNAEQLRTNQATLTIAVQQAAASQGISQDQLEQILRRVSEHHGEGLAQQLLARLGPGPPPPPAGAAAERVSFGTDPMMQDALNARRHRDERAEDVPEHRGPMDMRALERTVDRVAAHLGRPASRASSVMRSRSLSPMSVTPSIRLRAALAAMRGRPEGDDDEF